MTYSLFLMIFLGLPLGILGFVTWFDVYKKKDFPQPFSFFSFGLIILIHIFLAVVYTTPWDNYLVANQVWYYENEKIAGILLGWVPLEEYLFFILQTFATGLWLRFLVVRLPLPKNEFVPNWSDRFRPIVILLLILLGSLVGLLLQWNAGTYISLILIWSIPPIILQFIFGGDVLRYHWRLVSLGVLVPTLYLSLADSFAIISGVWEINPEFSLNLFLGGVLPLEEFLFFLMTNTMISFGSCLLLAHSSHERMRLIFSSWSNKSKLRESRSEYDGTGV